MSTFEARDTAPRRSDEVVQPMPTANELAAERTDLAIRRTIMAADRSMMAWIRTGLSLISFGFTIYKLLQEAARLLRRARGSPAQRTQPAQCGPLSHCAGHHCHRDGYRRVLADAQRADEREIHQRLPASVRHGADHVRRGRVHVREHHQPFIVKPPTHTTTPSRSILTQFPLSPYRSSAFRESPPRSRSSRRIFAMKGEPNANFSSGSCTRRLKESARQSQFSIAFRQEALQKLRRRRPHGAAVGRHEPAQEVTSFRSSAIDRIETGERMGRRWHAPRQVGNQVALDVERLRVGRFLRDGDPSE